MNVFVDKLTIPKQKRLDGIITVASRMRRLSDLLFTQVQELYDYRARSFKSSWFAVLSIVNLEGTVDQKTLASRNNVSAAAISQTIDDLEKFKLVKVSRGRDRRSRLITLTQKGKKSLESIIPDLYDIESILSELVGSDQVEPFINILSGLERNLRNKSLKQRLEPTPLN